MLQKLFEFVRQLLGLSGEKSPSGPALFEGKILIRATANSLYPLVDWNDAGHLYRQLGHEVRGREGLFTLVLAELPATRFDIQVTDADPPWIYAYESQAVPMIGSLTRSKETYRFEEASDGNSIVTLSVEAQFVAGLSPRKWRFEQWKMDVSCHNALAKLKLLAEEGPEAVATASRRLVV